MSAAAVAIVMAHLVKVHPGCTAEFQRGARTMAELKAAAALPPCPYAEFSREAGDYLSGQRAMHALLHRLNDAVAAAAERAPC